MQNTFSQSGNDSKWFLKKSFFKIGKWHSRPPRDPPPLHGKCHLKFPFWFFEPFPNSNFVWCQIVLVPNCPGAKLSILLNYFGAKLSVFNFGAKLSNNPYMMTKRQKRGYVKKSDLAPSILDAGKFQKRTKLKPTMFNSTSAKAISDLIYDSSIP